MTDMLHGVASNAVRLAEDSRLLFARGRYESAVALAVLSLEETGKYYLLARKADDTALAAKLRSHTDKQKESAWFLVEAAILAFFEVLGEHGYEHKRERDITRRQREWLHSSEGRSFDQRLRSGEWPTGIMDKVTDLLSTRGVFDDFRVVQNGELSRLKERGFYVDESERIPITSDTSRRWLERAETMAQRALDDASGALDDHRFVTVKRDSLLQ